MRSATASALLWAVAAAATQPCRDQSTWPFAATSIWNTPIGSNASFVPAGIFSPPFDLPQMFYSDDDYFIAAAAHDPPTPWYNQGWWGSPTGAAHCNVSGPLVESVPFPFNVTLTAFGENNGLALLLPDNATILNMQPTYRCEAGGPLLALKIGNPAVAQCDIRGNGTWGAHGGSSLSTIGGTIRLGELLPTAPPIRHALKLELNAATYYYGVARPGYVWPALNCDGYAFNATDPHHYGGTNPHLSPGALLAIPSTTPLATLNLTTIPAARIAAALQAYGGYLVDDTYEPRGTLCAEHGVTDEFAAAYGWPFTAGATSGGGGAAWYADMVAVFQALEVVANNAPDAPGGGGTPMQPPPPPFC